MLKKFLIVFAAMTIPSLVTAQAANPAPAPLTKEIAAPVVANPAAAAPEAAAPAAAAPKSMDGSLPGYTPMKPTEGIGMPKPKEIDFQEQFSDNGQYAKWINNAILLPIITIISLFVLGLLLWVRQEAPRAAARGCAHRPDRAARAGVDRHAGHALSPHAVQDP